MCRLSYYRWRRKRLKEGLGPDDWDMQVPPGTCERCAVQLRAMAADAGYGDRDRLIRSYTLSEFSAYLLGALDRSAGDVRAAAKALGIRRGEVVEWWADPVSTVSDPTEPGLEEWPDTHPPCRNCGSPAVAILATPGGCVVYREDRRMAVCAQHLRNWGFIEEEGPVELLAEAAPGIARAVGW